MNEFPERFAAAPAPVAQPRMVEIGDTSTPANRLATLITSALGEHHPAMDDLAALVLAAAPAPVLTPAQQHADELLEALKGAANWIDRLGGASRIYRVLVNRVEATGQEGRDHG